jgi:putative hydrolase of the HAD superfamily
MAKVIVFDLDDTLYKEIDFLRSAYRAIACRLQDVGATDAYPQMMAWYAARQNVFDELRAAYRLNVSKSDLLQWYRDHVPQIALSDGAEVLLKKLIASGHQVGLITDGRTITQRHKISALGLLRYLEPHDILISEEFGSEKPDVRNYQYFMDAYPQSEFVYVGDNPAKDFVTPNRLGWATIGLLDDGRNIHPQNLAMAPECLPQTWVKSFEEMQRAITF